MASLASSAATTSEISGSAAEFANRLISFPARLHCSAAVFHDLGKACVNLGCAPEQHAHGGIDFKEVVHAAFAAPERVKGHARFDVAASLFLHDQKVAPDSIAGHARQLRCVARLWRVAFRVGGSLSHNCRPR